MAFARSLPQIPRFAFASDAARTEAEALLGVRADPTVEL
jgi:hypothetical protein